MPMNKISPGGFYQLSADATAGVRAWDQQARIVLRIGPLDLPYFERLLPHRPLLRELASLVRAWWHEPRIALTVPSIIIMTPGLYFFQTIVMLNQGEVLPAVQAGATCFFIVGAMAVGLAAARFLTERRWLVEA